MTGSVSNALPARLARVRELVRAAQGLDESVAATRLERGSLEDRKAALLSDAGDPLQIGREMLLLDAAFQELEIREKEARTRAELDSPIAWAGVFSAAWHLQRELAAIDAARMAALHSMRAPALLAAARMWNPLCDANAPWIKEAIRAPQDSFVVNMNRFVPEGTADFKPAHVECILQCAAKMQELLIHEVNGPLLPGMDELP